MVACTAYAAVRAIELEAGDTVAVSAAAGGVGTVVVQLLVVGSQGHRRIARPARPSGWRPMVLCRLPMKRAWPIG